PPLPLPPGVDPKSPIIIDPVIEAPVGQLTKVPVKLGSKAVGPLKYLVFPESRDKEVDGDDKFLRVAPQSDGEFDVLAFCVVDGKAAYRVVRIKAGKGPVPPPVDDDLRKDVSMIKEQLKQLVGQLKDLVTIVEKGFDNQSKINAKVEQRLSDLEAKPVPKTIVKALTFVVFHPDAKTSL